MKRIIAMLMVLMCMLALSGCGCDHDWEAADCTTPKTCSECGETKGEPLGHDWKDATCSAPKTCKDCGETKGDALPHTWVDATCETPDTCSVCGETSGSPLGHDWMDATYDAPKTCSVCGETEGEPLEQVASDFASSTTYSAIRSIIDENMGSLNPEYEFDAESGVLFISLTSPDGLAAALTANPDAMAESWEELKVSFCDLCTQIQSAIESSGYDNVTCCIMLLNDTNPDNVLLGIMFGEVIYDVMSE